MRLNPTGTARTVACPHCGKPAPYDATNRWRPFCCERCRAADLGAWASESYRVVGRDADDACGSMANTLQS